MVINGLVSVAAYNFSACVHCRMINAIPKINVILFSICNVFPTIHNLN